MIKWKETPFHRLYISLTLNLFRSIHYSKWWIWKTGISFSIACFLERQFLGEILFPWNLMAICTQVTQIQIKHISYELSLDGCRMSTVIISYKTSLDAQHLSAPGRIMLCICIFPLSILFPGRLISNEWSMESARRRHKRSEHSVILLFSTVCLSFCAEFLQKENA